MTDHRSERERIEAEAEPIAIVQFGILVFANEAFRKLVGVNKLAELESTLVLDLVSKTHVDTLKRHLSKAQHARPGESLKENVTLVSTLGQFHTVDIFSERIEFEDEECVRIQVDMPRHQSVVSRIKSLPWAMYASVAILLLFSSLPGLLLTQLNINNAPHVYFPPDEPGVIVNNALRESFPEDEVVLLVFDGVALYSDGFLVALNDLADELSYHPMIRKVRTVTTVDHISGSFDGFSVEPLIDVDLLEETHPADRPDIIRADRFAYPTLMARDGDGLSMVVIPEGADTSLKRLQLVNDIEEAVKKFRLEGYLKGTAGDVPADVAQLVSMLQNNMVFIPVTTTIGLALIWWLFRRPLAVAVSGIAIGAVVSMSIAVFVVFGRPFTLTASMIPPLLSALTIAALVHVFNAIQYAAQRGIKGADRVKNAMDEIHKPSLFSLTTTAAGLASLASSPIPPIGDFGLISAFGIVLIYVVVMWAVPQIFRFWDRAEWPSREGGLRWMDGFVRIFARIGIRYPLWVLGITVALTAAGAPQILRIVVESSQQEYFAKSHPFRQGTDLFSERFVGATPMDIKFEVDEVDGMLATDRLQAISDFQAWAEAQPEIDHTTSPADFIKEMNWGFHEEDDEHRRVPESDELISQYLFVYDGDDMSDFLNSDRQVARVALNLNVYKSSEIRAVMERISEHLEQSDLAGMRWDIGGIGRLFADMEDLLIRGQIYSLVGALGMIFVMLLFLWRSLWQSILTMLPNITPILFIFILMGLFGIWLDMAAVMIASVSVGIAVDDTIHVFSAFRNRINNGSSVVMALKRVYAKAGRAVVTTTIILSTQFITLVASPFTPFSKFGLLTAIGLIAALLFDLLVLPALLVLGYRKRSLTAVREKA